MAQTASFNANITKAATQLNSNAAKMNRSLALVEKRVGSVGAAGKALAGGFVVGEIIQAGKRALDYASSLGEISQQLGVTSKDLQVYRYAASQVGVSQEEMDKGLAKLTQTLGKARVGAEGPKEAFAALSKIIGVDIVATSRTAGDAIPKIADALSKVTDPAQRAAVEVALFGKAGQKLDTLLAGGKGQIDGLAQAAEKLGLVLSDQQIQKADETADKLAAMKQVLEANIAGIVADNATSILALANAIGSAAAAVANFLSSNPAKALGLLGALGGGLAAGLPGAVAGGLGGMALGDARGQKSLNAQYYANSRNLLTQVSVARGAGIDPAKSKTVQELIRQRNDLKAKLAAFRSPVSSSAMMAGLGFGEQSAPAVGGLDLPDFLASGGGGKKGGKSEAEKFADELDALMKKLNPVQAGIDEYHASVAVLDKALTSGAISQEQYETALANLPGEVASVTNGIEALGVSLEETNAGWEAMLDAALKGGPLAAIETQVDKVGEAFDRLNERREEFADNFSESFRGIAHDIIDLKNPLDIVRNLVSDLAHLFVDTFVAQPLVDLVKNKVGNPLSEKLITGTPSLSAALDPATLSLGTFTASVQAAATALAAIGGGGLGRSSGLMLPGSVSGGGGLLGTLLQVGSMAASAFGGDGNALGGTLGGAGAFAGLSDNIMKAGPIGDAFNIKLPGFASGGRPSGLSIVGERGPELFMPDTPGTIIPNGGLNNAFRNLRAANDRSGHTYNINVHGRMTERERRETAMQIASTLRSEQAKSARMGIGS